jgi:steroid delta-isomerase-like uncharacterized protein
MLNQILKNKLLSCLTGLVLLYSCQDAGKSLENQNRQIVETYFSEAWNKGNVDVLDQLLADDYINHTPSTPNPSKGAKGLKPIVLAIRKGFPDLHYEIKELIVTKDRAIARVVMTGTNTGQLFGMPPTGKKINVNQINIEKIINGEIAEHWRVTDEFSMMKQLGAL